MTTTITFATTKGGVGKTTLTHTYARHLADQGNKVLLIDLDQQGSLSYFYNKRGVEPTARGLFDGSAVSTVDVANNIELIPADVFIDELSVGSDDVLQTWFTTNAAAIATYDVVLIDTHPDMGVITRNAVKVADVVLSPVKAGSFDADGFTQFIGRLQRAELLTKPVYMIGSAVKHNTSLAHEFRDQQGDNVVAMIGEYEVFNKANAVQVSVFDLTDKHLTQIEAELLKIDAQIGLN